MNEKHRRRRLACVLVTTAIAAITYSAPSMAAEIADPGVTACDRLASSPYDSKAVAPAVQNILDLDPALAACQEELKRHPIHPRIQFLMGSLLDQLPRPRWTDSPGAELLKKSADQGYLVALFSLGKSYLKTWRRGKRRKGAQIMLQAARLGHLQAQAELPYFAGRMRSAKDRKEALRWGEAAIKRGSYDAMAAMALSNILIMPDVKKYPKAVEYLYKADRAGSLDAMALLGRLQVFPFAPNGLRDLLPENHYGGMRRMLDAANLGNKRAAFYLGLLYAGSTISVSPHRQKMVYWFCRAGERGRYMVAETLEKDVSTYRCPVEKKPKKSSKNLSQ
jgi:TPR repeat protein